jgi:hypothetical protein
MNAFCRQLMRAYQEEERLYQGILGLVVEQRRTIEADGELGEVRRLGVRIDELLGQVDAIERAVVGARERFEESRLGPEPRLSSLLEHVDELLDEIAAAQGQVAEALLCRYQSRQAQIENTRASMSAREARLAYGSD